MADGKATVCKNIVYNYLIKPRGSNSDEPNRITFKVEEKRGHIIVKL